MAAGMLHVCKQLADKNDAGMLNVCEQVADKAWAPACSTSASSSRIRMARALACCASSS